MVDFYTLADFVDIFFLAPLVYALNMTIRNKNEITKVRTTQDITIKRYGDDIKDLNCTIKNIDDKLDELSNQINQIIGRLNNTDSKNHN